MEEFLGAVLYFSTWPTKYYQGREADIPPYEVQWSLQWTVNVCNKRYNRLRQIHCAHVCHIVEAHPLKDGSGKKIRALHECPSNTSERWAMSHRKPLSLHSWKWSHHHVWVEKHNEEHTDVADYQELLDFLNVKAPSLWGCPRKEMYFKACQLISCPIRSLCRLWSHLLFACSKFRSLSDPQIELLCSKVHCLNCLRPGHFQAGATVQKPAYLHSN